MTSYAPFPAAHLPEGHLVQWRRVDGDGLETVTLRWENEGFTVNGEVSHGRIQYVMRLSATWQLRQFLLFRDLEDPDLWLATDGSGRWGEMNGAHRTELDGAYDIAMRCTPFTHTLPIRRLPLLDGHTADLPVVLVDPETLEVRTTLHRYTRLDHRHWRHEESEHGPEIEFEVDEFGLVLDLAPHFLRV